MDFHENFIESIPKKTTEDLSKNILKVGIKLHKTKRDWGTANEQVKSLLNEWIKYSFIFEKSQKYHNKIEILKPWKTDQV